MAVDVNKALDNLTTKTKGKSISKTYLKAWATRHATKIENDADIDDYINDRLEDIVEAGVEADRRVNAALKKATPEKIDNPEKDKVEIDEDELKDAPPYVKAMMKQMQGMSEKIEGFQKEKAASTMSDRFTKHEKFKNIPAKLLNGRIPKEVKDDDEFENIVNEVYEDLKEFETNVQQGRATNGRVIDRPGFGNNQRQQSSGGGAKNEATDAVKAFTATMNKSLVQKP